MDQRKNTENGFNENGFNTVEEALEDLRQGKLILLQMIRTEKTKEILSVRQNLQPQKILILWQSTEKA